MGCIKRNIFGRKAGDIKKTLIIPLVAVMLITAITPVVLADSHSDTIVVTFDPTGDIDLEINPETATFGAVNFGDYTNAPTEGGGATDYSLWNNGTVAAEVWIFQNVSTNTTNMNADTTYPLDLDEYGINITGSNAIAIPTANGTYWKDPLNASEEVTFGVNLAVGTGSQDWGAQGTTINVTGVVNT